MRQWEKIIALCNYKGIIKEENSPVTGIIYTYDLLTNHNDDGSGKLLMSGWSRTLQGAKRDIDKEYDIDPNSKAKWKEIKL